MALRLNDRLGHTSEPSLELRLVLNTKRFELSRSELWLISLSGGARILGQKQDISIVGASGSEPGAQVSVWILAVELEHCNLDPVLLTLRRIRRAGGSVSYTHLTLPTNREV